MSVENHPAFAEERSHLSRTLAQTDAQLRDLLSSRGIKVEETDQFEESMHAIRAAQEALETIRDEAVDQLMVAAREPYFGRIDFQEAGAAEPEPLYIGKTGLTEPGSNRPRIIDWRAPVAGLFYGSVGGESDRVAYEAPGGVVEGLLWLKRNLSIKGRRLQHIADARVMGGGEAELGGDPFLLYRLQESRDNKLRDIVSTIQAEQNAIIRAPRDQPLIIQGVAGSGKTTVALHRLAYLLYTHREAMAADRMVIFAPNRMFLDYIAEVLPELGVGGIRQVTFQDWALEQISDPVELVDPAARLEELFRPGAADQGSGRFKGSLRFKESLDEALERYEATFVPEADLHLWPGATISQSEVFGWFHDRYRRYPLNTRKDRIVARLRNWAKAQVDPFRGTLAERERKGMMMTALRQYLALWPKHSPLTLYREILGLRSTRRKGAPRWVTPEDLAPLVYLQERLEGLEEDRLLDHLVIDEAQDFSPFQIDLLRRLTTEDSFTILGDLSQGIHTYAGIDSWAEIKAVFPPGAVQYFELRRSYRSTHEIVTFANQVLIRAGASELLAEPVYREGEKVRLYPVGEAAWGEAVAAEVRRMRVRQASVAVVGRTEAECDRLHAALKEAGLEPERIRADQQRYLGGLSVIPSYLTKGLEFDGVILADAGAHNFGLNRQEGRLLYVVLTRALHELAVLYTGERSPLLEGAKGQ